MKASKAVYNSAKWKSREIASPCASYLQKCPIEIPIGIPIGIQVEIPMDIPRNSDQSNKPLKQTTETNHRNKPKRQTVKTWGQQPDSLADSEEQTSHRSYDKDGLGPHKRFD
jgi:hypothetical protein